MCEDRQRRGQCACNTVSQWSSACSKRDWKAGGEGLLRSPYRALSSGFGTHICGPGPTTVSNSASQQYLSVDSPWFKAEHSVCQTWAEPEEGTKEQPWLSVGTCGPCQGTNCVCEGRSLLAEWSSYDSCNVTKPGIREGAKRKASLPLPTVLKPPL
jgi:hypothetical protein